MPEYLASEAKHSRTLGVCNQTFRNTWLHEARCSGTLGFDEMKPEEKECFNQFIYIYGKIVSIKFLLNAIFP